MFLALGLIKAYFIVEVFMHMKYEKISLALTILVPVIFIIGLIMGLLYEGISGVPSDEKVNYRLPGIIPVTWSTRYMGIH